MFQFLQYVKISQADDAAQDENDLYGDTERIVQAERVGDDRWRDTKTDGISEGIDLYAEYFLLPSPVLHAPGYLAVKRVAAPCQRKA